MEKQNVIKNGKTVHVERCTVVGAKADFGKKEIRLTMSITLDESSLEVRNELAYWQFDATPIKMTLKPIEQQLGLPGLTVDRENNKIEIDLGGDNADDDDDAVDA
jgi:hypothetical protein